MRLSGIIGIIAAVGLTAATTTATLAYAPTVTKPTVLSSKTVAATRSFLKLAQTHADICKQNYDNCMQGCAGATSCSNQCMTNYNGCMQQGG
jgi:hypothetical protein